MLATPIRLLIIGSMSLGCSGATNGEPRARHQEERSLPAPSTPVDDEVAAEPDPGSPCGRALACCRAYAGAIPDVVEASACRGVLEAAATEGSEPRCRSMTAGWRQALEHLGEATSACE